MYPLCLSVLKFFYTLSMGFASLNIPCVRCIRKLKDSRRNICNFPSGKITNITTFVFTMPHRIPIGISGRIFVQYMDILSSRKG